MQSTESDSSQNTVQEKTIVNPTPQKSTRVLNESIFVTLFILAFVPLVAVFILHQKHANNAINLVERLTGEVNSLKTEINNLENEAEYLGWLIDAQEDEDGESGSMALFKDTIVAELIERSRINAREKFGHGPHIVEIELDFPPDYAPPGKANRFTIELAPLDLMPYTVNFFLEQVSRKLYDGCSFVFNDESLILGGQKPGWSNEDEEVWLPFYDAGFARYTVPEYNDEYPHEEYTIGFAGKSGGEFFYINTDDNTYQNGPEGQGEFGESADPCFGTIISGFDAVRRLQDMAIEDDADYGLMMQSVGIKSARIVGWEEKTCS